MTDNSSKQVKELQNKIAELQKQAEESLNGWKRAKADYLNREREIERDKINWINFANLELILHLLPILDSFDQLFKNLPPDLKNDEWIKGTLKIKEQFENILKTQGIERIKTIGEKFNPDFHEVVDKKGDEGEIVEEVQSGYSMHGRTIRPAKVVIK